MSFSGEVREEIFRRMPGPRQAKVSLAAILSCIGRFTWSKEAGYGLELGCDNRQALIKCFTLIQKTSNINLVSLVEMTEEGAPGRVLDMRSVLPEDDIRELADLTGFLSEDGRPGEQGAGVSEKLLKSDKDLRAFLADTFLCIGSVTDPNRGYRLEFNCSGEQCAQQIRRTLERTGLQAAIGRRRSNHVVYLRDSEAIVDTLNLMGASGAALKMENAIIVRQMRGSINRKVNCDLANIRKSVEAARRQGEDIRLVVSSPRFRTLPDSLKQIARLRLDNPDVSLKELGEMLDPPVGKSGVNHRLRKLSEIAREIRKNTARPDEE